MKFRSLILVVCGLSTPSAFAVITAFTASGNDLNTITVDGVTHSAASLTNVTLTGITDTAGRVQLLAPDGTVPVVGNRAALFSDLALNTGSANAQSLQFTFNTPVTNRPGIDILLFDWGGFGADSFSITINGTTSNNLFNSDPSLPPGGDYHSEGDNLLLGADVIRSTTDTSITTVAELELLSLERQSDSTASQGVIGLDLDAFGVAAGDSISVVDISNISGADFTLVLGIPEPSTAVLSLLGTGFLLRRKR